ncbi:DUF6030 family protein [Devosia nitrariae]|nr:DUF6030 family protein [Devosia nitrariae]
MTVYFLISWASGADAQERTGVLFRSDVPAEQLSLPLTPPRPSNAQFEPNPALSRPELQVFTRTYPFAPEHACAVAISVVEPDEYVSTAQGAVQTCYWIATVPNTNVARCAAAEASARLEPECPPPLYGSPGSLFFIARGDAATTQSLRIKLNSGVDRLRADLPFLLEVVTWLHQERSWSVPSELARAVAEGKDVALEHAGVRYELWREVGDVPRYNLTLTFAVWQVTNFD